MVGKSWKRGVVGEEGGRKEVVEGKWWGGGDVCGDEVNGAYR